MLAPGASQQSLRNGQDGEKYGLEIHQKKGMDLSGGPKRTERERTHRPSQMRKRPNMTPRAKHRRQVRQSRSGVHNRQTAMSVRWACLLNRWVPHGSGPALATVR